MNWNKFTNPLTSMSPWMLDIEPPSYPIANQNLRADSVVVGGGIAGLSIAYELVQRGYKPILIERGVIGGGQSGRTTAHISYAFDDGFHVLRKLKGDDACREVIASHLWGVQRIKHIATSENIPCGWQNVPGYLFADNTLSATWLDLEFQAACELEVPDVSNVWRTPGIPKVGRSIAFPNQAQIHLQRYMRGLAECITRGGGQIFCQTQAVQLLGHSLGYTLKIANGYTIDSERVVIATHQPDTQLLYVPELERAQKAYITYVITAKIPKNSLPKALYWDNNKPYHHVRTVVVQDADYDLAMIGGEDHMADEPADPENYAKLEQWGRAMIPQMGEVLHQWAGTVMEPEDYIGLIGKIFPNENIYICTGDSGHGIVQAAIAGKIISEQIDGITTKWTEIYRPDRVLPAPDNQWNRANAGESLRQYGLHSLARAQEDQQKYNQSQWGRNMDSRSRFSSENMLEPEKPPRPGLATPIRGTWYPTRENNR